MSNSNFDKNGVDNSGKHWPQYAAFVVTALASMFGEGLETSSNRSKTLILDLSLFINVNFSIFSIKNYRKIIYFFE